MGNVSSETERHLKQGWLIVQDDTSMLITAGLAAA
jgi:hypothetical protein